MESKLSSHKVLYLYDKRHEMLQQLKVVDQCYGVRLKLAAYGKYTDEFKDICTEELDDFMDLYREYKELERGLHTRNQEKE